MKVKLCRLRLLAERPYFILIREISVMSCCNLLLCLSNRCLDADATFPAHVKPMLSIGTA